MISADLHSHTGYSHGSGSPAEMLAAAGEKGLSIFGFSEHSPRPAGFDYSHEYREKLNRHLPVYVKEVLALKQDAALHKADGACQVLLGMEMDWLEGQEDFIRAASGAYDFDYLLGSVHFLDNWGFDDSREPWEQASQEECERRYVQYFNSWKKMLQSCLFQIAAHPDLIKIYSVEQFHIWLDKPESLALIRQCLLALRDSGMAMEISSAGLRKACREIYPCARIMAMAAELELPVSMASDAHCPLDVAGGFARLASYAKAFGFKKQTIYNHGRATFLNF